MAKKLIILNYREGYKMNHTDLQHIVKLYSRYDF